ncbi:S-adenosylhomocysteine deaminase [Desulfocarbo indianensis]|nr:S-adenosylhomocysteine deaminase [Desulfocarbo indianensis]
MRELCISGGTILTMDQAGTVIPDGMLCIEDGRITYCGPRHAADAPPREGCEELDARGGLIMPGLINGHTHAAMTLLRGMADDLPLEKWLTEHIFPAETKLTGEAVYWGTMLACAEMIRNGVTSFCDMYLFERQTAKAADAAGLRAMVGEVIYDFPSPSYGELENGFAVTRELIAGYASHPRIKAAVMPHALYTCSPSLLERAGRLAGETGADLHIHLAETREETAQVVSRYGKRPLDHLESLGLLNRALVAAHAVDLTPDEVARLARAGARVAHCPESNMKLASGVAPLMTMLEAGVKVGLGTDGCASNNDLDLLGEMDSCAKLHKASALDPTAAPAETVAALATRLGGEAFGRLDLGILAEGMLADVIVIDIDQPHLTPMYNPYSHLVYAARGADVIHTVCHGKVLMADRKLKTMDLAEVMAKAREQAARLNGRAS